MGDKKLKILHVTEAMGSGVLHLVQTLSRRQVEQGVDVSLWFAARPETPSEDVLRDMFDPRVKLQRYGAKGVTFRSQLSLMNAVRVASTGHDFDVIHLHSSKAGVFGRLATWNRRKRSAAVVYSPHGFAFLRDDLGRVVRHIARLTEGVLARRCDALVLSASSERHLASSLGPGAATYVLKTGVSAEHLKEVAPNTLRRNRRLRVAMIGRICYQKAPWRFSSAARALGEHADFVWIGDGDREAARKWLGDSEVRITGWLPTDELARQIDEIDVLLFPTLWEGMALSLMQAQAQGVPAVVSDVVGNVDTIVHGKTGFVCRSDEDLIKCVKMLLLDHKLRQRMAVAAVEWAKESLLDTDLGTDSISIYRSVRALKAGMQSVH